MKICAIYGTERKGCTWHIAQEVLSRLPDAEVTEFFLPRDCPDNCISCFRCFNEENRCYQSKSARKIQEVILESDVILMTSPVYALHVSGAMKNFLDHYCSMWIVHKPEAAMFRKRALVIATASGPVYRAALKEMKDSLDFWGVARTYRMGYGLNEIRWDHLTPKLHTRITKQAVKTARNLQKPIKKPGIKAKFLFYAMRIMEKHVWTDSPDANWWRIHGWLGRARPWKQEVL